MKNLREGEMVHTILHVKIATNTTSLNEEYLGCLTQRVRSKMKFEYGITEYG
tara:strand:+ start:1763 stop:1918 length:156 start_codon:yes stop_codon:yes gene_type:complete